jgi:protein gp37
MSTGIEWTDETWNPMTGCTKISTGCDHCYAQTVARTKTRDIYLRQPPVKDTPANRDDPFAPRFWTERLTKPFSWRKPRRVFVNSMSDVFHAQFSLEQIQQVFDVMNALPQHQFQVLTKRPERALRLADGLQWTENIWMGTSIENMDVARRADALRAIPAYVHFISAEPLLGPLDQLNLDHIEWVIGGGESGIGHRECDVDWARGLRQRCVDADVHFFWKQWGGRTPKAGGRELDGRVWSEYPVALTPSAKPLPSVPQGNDRQSSGRGRARATKPIVVLGPPVPRETPASLAMRIV